MGLGGKGSFGDGFGGGSSGGGTGAQLVMPIGRELPVGRIIIRVFKRGSAILVKKGGKMKNNIISELLAVVIVAGSISIAHAGTVISHPGSTPHACTYTYSEWGACLLSGMQTRTVVSATPADCIGTPLTSQSCASPQRCVYTYSEWSACNLGVQSRSVTSTSPASCTGKPITSQTCTYVAPPPPSGVWNCVYTYSEWGPCDGTTRKRSVTSTSPAGCTGPTPPTPVPGTIEACSPTFPTLPAPPPLR